MATINDRVYLIGTVIPYEATIDLEIYANKQTALENAEKRAKEHIEYWNEHKHPEIQLHYRFIDKTNNPPTDGLFFGEYLTYNYDDEGLEDPEESFFVQEVVIK